jgi:hypothetical protein
VPDVAVVAVHEERPPFTKVRREPFLPELGRLVDVGVCIDDRVVDRADPTEAFVLHRGPLLLGRNPTALVIEKYVLTTIRGYASARVDRAPGRMHALTSSNPERAWTS